MISSMYRRRDFVRGVGAGMFAYPFLHALQSGDALGAAAPRRIVFFYFPHGASLTGPGDTFVKGVTDMWNPRGTSKNFTLPILTQELNENVSATISEKLSSHCTFIRGMNYGFPKSGDSHHPGHLKCLTGREGTFDGPRARGVSLDQYLGKLTQPKYGANYALNLGAGGRANTVNLMISFDANGNPAPMFENPADVYSDLFGGAPPTSAPSSPMSPSTPDNAMAFQKSSLDVLTAELASLKGKVGAAERIKLDEHLTSIRNLEGKLQAAMPGTQSGAGSGPAPTCDAFSIKAVDSEVSNTSSREQVGAILDAHILLSVMALKCDRTRVVTIKPLWGEHNAKNPGDSGSVHESSHHFNGADTKLFGEYTKWQQLWVSKFASLLRLLRTTPDVDGSNLLANTVVVLFSELGDSHNHNQNSVPYILGGSCGGFFRTGEFFDFIPDGTSKLWNYKGKPHNMLLVSLAQAFGQTSLEQFGAADPELPGAGPLSEIHR